MEDYASYYVDERTCFNLECEVPLKFKLLLPPSFNQFIITLDTIENSSEYQDTDSHAKRIKNPIIKEHPTKLITIAYKCTPQDAQQGKEARDALGITLSEEIIEELDEARLYFITTLRLLSSRRVWLLHYNALVYSDFIPEQYFGFSDVGVGLIKTYKLGRGDIERIEHLMDKTHGEQFVAFTNIFNTDVYEKQTVYDEAPADIYSSIGKDIDVALLYYILASDEYFYKEEVSFVQLSIALEALFLLENEVVGKAEKLGNRVATLLGENQENRKRIKTTTRKLYRLRNKLVHGLHKANKVEIHHRISDLFEFVRLSLLYFIGLNRCKYEKEEIVATLDKVSGYNNPGALREKIRDFYGPRLNKVLQLNS